MPELHPSLRSLTIPRRMAGLPLDERGFPVPYFVAYPNGEPDFRVADTDKLARCVKHQRCWLCGGVMGRYLAFPIGPMCAVNRTTAEPPSHRECAEFGARACPFLTNPEARRRRSRLPDQIEDPAGEMIRRNPGVTLIWITKNYRPFRVDNGVLFRIGDPTEVLWFCQGRPATRAEVLASIESGLPLLREPAEQQGREALLALGRGVNAAMQLLPAA